MPFLVDVRARPSPFAAIVLIGAKYFEFCDEFLGDQVDGTQVFEDEGLQAEGTSLSACDYLGRVDFRNAFVAVSVAVSFERV